ncbi:MAG: hypothetical protein WCV62_05270 [Candidatus Peribacteraceae bacterium]|jgi:starch synthase
MHPFLPSYDSLIARKFSIGTLDLKLQNKTALQRELGWPAEPRRPMVCLPAGMTDKLGGDILMETLPGLLTLPMEILILGKGSEKYGALFTKLAADQNHRVHIVTDDEKEVHQMLAASDMALFLKDASGMEAVANSLQYGVVPIAPAGTDLLEDYDPVQETGNGFLFERSDRWGIFAAFVRAAETHKFPFDWRTIQRHCMETVMKKERRTS